MCIYIGLEKRAHEEIVDQFIGRKTPSGSCSYFLQNTRSIRVSKYIDMAYHFSMPLAYGIYIYILFE